MTHEQLLQPRYLVIADYPGSEDDGYFIGQIKENIAENYCKLLDEYPHLFRRLEWWEYRDEKDMPEYLNENEHIMKVCSYKTGSFSGMWGVLESGEYHSLHECLPATAEEYEQYINSKK